MESDSKKNTGWRGGSAFRFSGAIDFTKFKIRLRGIITQLLRLIVDDEKRREALPENELVSHKIIREFVEAKGTVSEEWLKKSFPKEIVNYYLESLKKLHDLGKTYDSKSKEEKKLCEALKKFTFLPITPEYDEDDKKINLIIKSPIQGFINEYHTEIINIRRQYLGNYKPLKEPVSIEGKHTIKYNTIESFLCSSKLRASELKRWLRFLEDGAIKYPRLMHVILEWPLMTKMPIPPREILDYCEPEEYEYMLKRRKAPNIIDSEFSTLETQSTAWLIYPKGESWCKESGIKLFHELFYDISLELSCNWEQLLHSYGLTMSYGNNHHLLYDGWDGLFDEEYSFYFDEQGWRNGLYNCYYITDVFYESIRLCRYLLETVCKESNIETDIPKRENIKENAVWSKPMPKSRMMAILGIDSYETFNAFADRHGIEKLNRSTYRIRLDMMDSGTRQKLEKA